MVRLDASGDPAKTIVEQRPIFDWLVIKIEHSDRDIPVVADINLNVI